MTAPDQNADVIAVARQLAESFDQMAGKLEDVKTASEERDLALASASRRNLSLILGTIGGFVLDIALTVVIAVVAIQAHDANTTAHAVAVSNRALCESSNKARAEQIGLWTYLIMLAGPPKTAEARRFTAEFEHHLRVVFAPRNCSHINPAHP